MSDRERLQGTWRQVEAQSDIADEHGVDEFGTDVLTTFEVDRFTVHRTDGTVLLHGTFVLHADNASDWIDAIGPDAGRVLPARYQLSERELVFVVGDPDRPASLDRQPTQVLRRLVRVPLP
ncbi:MAG: TIGR03067 domain-containing protein [Kofleriaceae bacterium]